MKYKKIIAECNPSQTHEELNDLLLELENFEIKNVLEIGVHKAGSMRVWQEALDPNILIGIDWKLEPEFKSMKKNRDSQYVIKIEGKSQDKSTFNKVKLALMGTPIDFLFIDGSHYYQDVKDDFEMYQVFIRPGGVIAFHDVVLRGNDTVEVYKLWEEIQKEYKTKTISYFDKIGLAATGCGILYL